MLLLITLVGIPFAIRTLIRWSFGAQAVILNQETAKDAITHSCRLVKGLWWQIAGAGLLLLLPVGLVNVVAAFFWPRGLSGTILTSVLGLFTGPIWAAFWTLLYLRLAEQDGSTPVAVQEAL